MALTLDWVSALEAPSLPQESLLFLLTGSGERVGVRGIEKATFCSGPLTQTLSPPTNMFGVGPSLAGERGLISLRSNLKSVPFGASLGSRSHHRFGCVLTFVAILFESSCHDGSFSTGHHTSQNPRLAPTAHQTSTHTKLDLWFPLQRNLSIAADRNRTARRKCRRQLGRSNCASIHSRRPVPDHA